jgi:hypothetical protein
MQGDIDQPSPGVRRVFDPARAGVDAPLMRGDETRAFVIQKSGLRTVAVMRVEVNDHHALQTVCERILRGDGDVAEDAKSHRAVRLGVMPRRADDGKGILCLALQHRPRAGDDAARRKQRIFVRRFQSHTWEHSQ